MKQLAIQNGDLVLGAGGYAMVQGASKLRQDLSQALREPYGVDRFHPRWGSSLPSFVGITLREGTPTLVRSEVFRVVKNYINSRISQLQQDQVAGVKPRYVSNELVKNVDDVTVRQSQDRLNVRVTLTTLSADRVSLVTSVEG